MKIKAGIIFILSFLVLSPIHAEEDQGKVISSLRELASKLGWSQDVFVSVKMKNEEYQVMGISDVSFSSLSYTPDKSYVQWLVGKNEVLKKVLKSHLKSYRRLGFEIEDVEGLGEETRRAVSVSYLASGKELVLTQYEDVIEILSGETLLTLRDDRTQMEADAWVIFEDIFEQAQKDHFITPLPKEMPESTTKKDPFLKFPKRINPLNCFPENKTIPIDAKGWTQNKIPVRLKVGQTLSVGTRYRYLKQIDAPARPEVYVQLHAFASPGQAQWGLDLYFKRLKKKKGMTCQRDKEKGHGAFWMQQEKEQSNRLLTVQGIFICDVRVSWKGVDPLKRRELAESFTTITGQKIATVLSQGEKISRTNEKQRL